MNHSSDKYLNDNTSTVKPDYYAQELTSRLKIIWDIGREHIQANKKKIKEQYDKKAKERGFQLGQMVLLRQDKIPAQASRKLYRKFCENPFISQQFCLMIRMF